MSSPAQLAASTANAQHSTGPRTEQGKAASSKNAIKNGLFSASDFIRPGEETLYAELCASVTRELAPVGELESTFATEIRRAVWRLRRCGETEAAMVEQCLAAANGTDSSIPDPMQIEATAKLQLAVDRARAQCHRLLHRCTAELRKLQTERIFRSEELGPKVDTSRLGVADFRLIRKSMDESIAGVLRKHKVAEIESDADLARAMALPEEWLAKASQARETETRQTATKQTETRQSNVPTCISRNSRCACGSGIKYKRCCGLKAALGSAARSDQAAA